jgi:hypothetical protein
LIQQWKAAEKTLLDGDNLIKTTNKAKNDLERKIYDSRANVTDEDWKDFVTPKEGQEIVHAGK